jgi:hypothetical protein
MRRCNWTTLGSVLTATAILASACSREGNGKSGPGAQGGSADPGSSVSGGVVDGATEPRLPGPPMNFEKAPVTNLFELFHTNNPEAYWTRAIQLSGVTVQQIFPDKQFIVIGPDNDHTLLVQMFGSHPEIKTGGKVDVAGIIDPIGFDKTQWNVTADEQKILARHSIYIQARSIQASRQ